MHRVDHQRPTRTAVTIAGAVALIAWSLFLAASPVRATPTTLFEIADADIADATGPVGDPPDWGSIFGRTPTNTAGAPVSVVNPRGMSTPSFVEDLTKGATLPSPPCSPSKTGDLTVLAGNGSDKNGDALSTWSWGAGNIPPLKDDITNLYGAAGTDTNAHRMLYFGLERAANNGSGHLDVEFLKAPMGRTVTGSDAGSGCPEGSFSGSRTQGDVLLILDLSKGGALGLSELRIWNATTSTYDVTTPATGTVGIAHNETSSIACGDWNCRTPTANTTALATNTFVEGFVDATALGLSGCFAAFNAKSRSSASWDSELKDIAFGEFNTCDARITISPNAVNEVGTTHTFTGHVDTNASGSFASAADGTTISFSIVSGPGSFTGGVNTCTTTGGTGSCTVGLTSASAGTTVVAASTSVLVGPVTVTRSTNGTAGPGGSGNASKIWADGYVKVTPSAVNEVNQSHEFTVEFGVTKGSGATVGTPTITPSVSPTPNGGVASGCASPTSVGTDVWKCTVTINSSVAGAFTATASASAVVSGPGTPSSATIARSTSVGSHGTGGNTGATKTYVDARISLSPSGLNAVGNAHALTAAVKIKNGTGAWTAAPDGTTVAFTRTGAGGYAPTFSGSCVTAGGTGQCGTSIVSSVVGTTQVTATTTLTVGTVSLTRTTGVASNTAAGGTSGITKKWVDASVRMLDHAVNQVGDRHLFTVTVLAHRTGTETVTFGTITPSVSPTPSSSSTTCATPTIALDGLSATCTLTVNSTDAGLFDADATATVSFAEGTHNASVTRSTGPAVGANAGPSGNGGVTKTYVDARLSVGPDGVNPVGSPHTLTGTAEYNAGSGWVLAAGKTITFATTQGPGGFVSGINTCVTGASGTCTVQIVSATPGAQWVSASTSYAVGGVTLSRTTAGTGPTDPANARKEWVTASISVSPSATNEVGSAHSFTVTVTGQSGGTAVAISNVATTVSPSPSNKSDDCGVAVASTGPSGTTLTCTLTINSTTPGVFTANATATVTIGSVVTNVATNGTGGQGAAVKTYVDARISVGLDGVNEVGDDHPVSAHVETNAGSGWANAPLGTLVSFAIASGPGALSAPTCKTAAGGLCAVTLSSAAAGVAVVSGTTTLTVGGLSLTRSTAANAGHGGSGNLTKRWVDAAVSISPTAVNPVGAPHTFTVTATAVPSGAAPVSFGIVPAVTPTPDSLVTSCATPSVVGDVATCTVTITDQTPGVFTAHATTTVTMGGTAVVRSTNAGSAPRGPGGSGPATKTFVDADITVGPSGVNAVGDPHTFIGTVHVNPGSGRVPATAGTLATFTVKSGPGAPTSSTCVTIGATGACSVTVNSPAAGVSVVGVTATVEVLGVRLDLTSNGAGANSADAVKRWVDASVAIGPAAINPLDEPHTFTITVTATPSGATPVTFASITPLVAPAPSSVSSTCANPSVIGNVATCTITINSSEPGTFVANATASVLIGGVSLLRSTDAAVAVAGPAGTGAATKIYERLAVLAGEVHQDLPRTGADLDRMVLASVGLIIGGAAIMVGARRRRPSVISPSRSHDRG